MLSVKLLLNKGIQAFIKHFVRGIIVNAVYCLKGITRNIRLYYTAGSNLSKHSLSSVDVITACRYNMKGGK